MNKIAKTSSQKFKSDLTKEINSAEKIFSVFNLVHAGVFVLRKDFIVLFWNCCIENWTAIKKNKILGKKITNSFPNLKDEKYTKRIADIFNGGGPTVFSSKLHKYLIKDPLLNGKSRIHQTMVTSVPGINGKGSYALFFLQDTTYPANRIKEFKSYRNQALKEIEYRKKVEDELRNSHELLRKVMEDAPNVIFLIDLDGKFSFLNNAGSEISGYDTEELKGEHFSILFDDESFPHVNDQFNKLAIQGTNIARFETEIVCKDGKKRFITFSLSPIFKEGKISSIVCTGEDITKRKYAEKQLQQQAIEREALSHISRILIQAESEQAIYDQIPQIISNFFRLEVVSIELFDKQKDEIIFMGSTGIPLSDTIPIREPAKGTVSGDVIKNGKAVILSNIARYPNYKFKLLKKRNITLFACLPMKIKKKVIGTLCLGSIEKEYLHESMSIILQTIADAIAQTIVSKKAETKLKEYKQHLEQLVEKRTEQLKATQEKLIHAAKLSAVGKLSASIAHEFNNPICGIRNVLERVNERILNGVNLDETHKELAAMAIKECNRIADLTRKLQDFHRPSSGIVTKMNIHNAIDEILLMGKKRLNERNIILNKRYARNILRIEAVSDQIKQVILNIIQNAEEAIPKEGGEITITTERAKSNLKIHIKDNGSGIPPQYMNTIFEPFFTTKPAVKGTGLGLFISYGIIKKHGGNIDVKSLFGKGTTFTIILPIKTKY